MIHSSSCTASLLLQYNCTWKALFWGVTQPSLDNVHILQERNERNSKWPLDIIFSFLWLIRIPPRTVNNATRCNTNSQAAYNLHMMCKPDPTFLLNEEIMLPQLGHGFLVYQSEAGIVTKDSLFVSTEQPPSLPTLWMLLWSSVSLWALLNPMMSTSSETHTRNKTQYVSSLPLHLFITAQKYISVNNIT